MMIWLLNSLEEKISGSVMFFTTVKEMWDTLKVMCSNEKNPSRVFEIYERLFELKQGDRSVPEFYKELKSLIDELEMHQPAVIDAATLRISSGYNNFKVSIWLEFYTTIPDARLDTGGDSIPTFTLTFLRIIRVLYWI